MNCMVTVVYSFPQYSWVKRIRFICRLEGPGKTGISVETHESVNEAIYLFSCQFGCPLLVMTEVLA